MVTLADRRYLCACRVDREWDLQITPSKSGCGLQAVRAFPHFQPQGFQQYHPGKSFIGWNWAFRFCSHGTHISLDNNHERKRRGCWFFFFGCVDGKRYGFTWKTARRWPFATQLHNRFYGFRRPSSSRAPSRQSWPGPKRLTFWLVSYIHCMFPLFLSSLSPFLSFSLSCTCSNNVSTAK